MAKEKIREVKKTIKITEVKKDSEEKKSDSVLEKEVEFESFSNVNSKINEKTFVPTLEQNESVIQNQRIVRELPKTRDNTKANDLPEFSESARYNINNRTNSSEERAKYNSGMQRENSTEDFSRSNNFRSSISLDNKEIQNNRNFNNQNDFSKPFSSVLKVENDLGEIRKYEERIDLGFEEKRRNFKRF